MSTSGDRITQLLDEFRHKRDLMVTELGKVVIGQREVIEQILAAIFTRGHVLLVGVPGPGQDPDGQLAREDPRRRLQAHPVHARPHAVGHHRHERAGGARGRSARRSGSSPGPIFSNILLADEINRTPPKTQAALLQAMQEREVTVGQETLHLPDPFFVIATQNPIEQEGTYPLPEAQLDRFMFDIRVGYPSYDEEGRSSRRRPRGSRPT